MGDVDDWFVKAKQLGYREERCGDAYKHPGGPICSFHYVETAEARVLYHLLDHALYSSNAAKILEMWPSNGSALGGYSRKLASLNEAEMLKSYISVIDF